MTKSALKHSILIIFSVALIFSIAGAVETFDVTLKGDGTSGPYRLTSAHIAVNSDSIWLDGRKQLRGTDYEIEYNRGEINFVNQVDSSSVIRVVFMPVFFDAGSPYFLYDPTPFKRTGQTIAGEDSLAIDMSRSKEDYQPGLSIGGSKSLSFEFGNNLDPDFSQAMDLSIRGPVVRGVSANAFVSDKGTPAVTGGSSSTIEELDKFFINITAKNFSATLGDFQVDFDELTLANYSKKLKGITAAYDDEKNFASASGASSRGRFTINRFSGREGDQGPYFLTDNSGARGFAVLPGTEKVFIDGQQAARGADNDYIIDYPNAHITFTPKMLITSETRIEVEFEYSSREYSRGFYTSRIYRGNPDLPVSIGGVFIAEVDDKGRPLNTILSEEDKQAIVDAGGEGEYAYKSGVEFVGPDSGDYIQRTDTTGYIYYEYAGVDSGEYDISFSNLGYGNGDYIYIGRGIYQFEGQNMGEYAPVKRLPVPKAHYLYGADIALKPSKNLDFRGEAAYSRFNRNTFAGNDAIDDAPAFLLNGHLTLNTDGAFFPDTIDITSRFRHTSENFAPFAEYREADYYNKWNLPVDFIDSDENIGEFSSIYGYRKRYFFNVDAGYLDRGGNGNSRRYSLGARLDLPADMRFSGVYNRSMFEANSDTAGFDSSGKLEESKINYEIKQWIFTPSLGYQYRNDVDYRSEIIVAGDRFNIYTAGLSIKPINRIENKISYSIQNDDLFQGGWLREDEAVTIKESISFYNIPDGFRVNYDYTYRQKKFKEVSGTDSRQNLSYLRSSFDKGAFNIEYNHKYNRTRSALKILRYVEVEEGDGDYRFENGEYIPDPFGNYIQIIEEAGEFRPVSEIENDVLFQFDGRRLDTDDDFLSKIELETELNFLQKTEETGVKILDMINPWRDIERELIVNEQLVFIQDLYYVPGKKSSIRDIRLRYGQNRSLSGGGSFAGEFDDRRYGALRLRGYLGGGFSTVAEYTRERRIVVGITDLTLDSDIINPDLIYSPVNALEVGMGLKYRQDRENLDDFVVNLFSVLPHARWNFSEKGRVDLNSEIIRVWSDEREFFSFRIAEGNRVGENYRVSIRGIYKIGDNSTGELVYNFRKLANEDGRHFARMQVKYSF
ncbi:MAG: hypothetical protein GF307_10240 [candidate division Zixibacteria bacterium]|nr:hypothetical protein [candidate division Zixibacteria bacterium]